MRSVTARGVPVGASRVVPGQDDGARVTGLGQRRDFRQGLEPLVRAERQSAQPAAGQVGCASAGVMKAK